MKPKLRYYHELRGSFEMANHLKYNLTKKKRALLSQLSCGVLPLRVETGRYHPISQENRVCELCDENITECELHFLFGCNAYREIRAKLYHKLPELLNHSSHLERWRMLINVPYSYGNYVDQLWNERTKQINAILCKC